MEAYAHQAKDKLANLTETVSTQATQVASDVRDQSIKVASDVRDQSIKAGSSIREKVVNPLDTIDKARAGFDSVFNAQRLDQAKAKLDSEASLVVGYKDQFIGAFKEAFGHILNDHDLKMAGAEQRSKGEAEVKLQKTLEERKVFEKQSAQFLEALKRREAVMADLVHYTYTTQLRHVEAPLEPAVADLFLDSAPYKLKQWNKQPLLQEIRERRTMKPMLFVQVREKGLMNSIPLAKKDMSTNFKARSATLADLRWAIRHSGAQKLKSVPESSISDRSAPRLERNRAAVFPEGNRARLLEEVQEGAALKHVETVDKAQPAIESKGMGEMRQATELKQF